MSILNGRLTISTNQQNYSQSRPPSNLSGYPDTIQSNYLSNSQKLTSLKAANILPQNIYKKHRLQSMNIDGSLVGLPPLKKKNNSYQQSPNIAIQQQSQSSQQIPDSLNTKSQPGIIDRQQLLIKKKNYGLLLKKNILQKQELKKMQNNTEALKQQAPPRPKPRIQNNLIFERREGGFVNSFDMYNRQIKNISQNYPDKYMQSLRDLTKDDLNNLKSYLGEEGDVLQSKQKTKQDLNQFNYGQFVMDLRGIPTGISKVVVDRFAKAND
eukprot:403347413